MNPKPMQTLLDQTFSLDSKTSYIYAEWPKLGVPRAYAEFEVSQIAVQTLGEGEGTMVVGDLRPARQILKRGYKDPKN